MQKIRSWRSIKLITFALFMLAFVVVMRWGIVTYVYNTELSSRLKLQAGTDLWWIWTEMPITMFTKVYFFNVTNPKEVGETGGKPKLVQMGPYVYQEKRNKIILHTSDEDVKYRSRLTYSFRPDLSYGSENDNITLLNVPFAGVAKMATEFTSESFMLSTLDDLLSEKGETLFHTRKVKDYLFDGISIENFMELLNLPIAQMIGKQIEIPEKLKDGKFGYFEDRNGTAEDVWVVNTGKVDKPSFGKIMSLNGASKLSIWNGDKCNRIDGSDGSLYPFGDFNRVLHTYSSDLCRSVTFKYDMASEYNGVPTLRYVLNPEIFQSIDTNPENKCYCKNVVNWCKKGGLLPLGPCFDGAPVFASEPHFANAPKSVKDGVEGLSSNGDYATFMEIEPHIGLPIRATLRMQVNMELKPIPAMETFESPPHVMFPILWIEETFEVPRDLMLPIWLMVKLLQTADFLTGLGIALCVAILAVAGLFGFLEKKFG